MKAGLVEVQGLLGHKNTTLLFEGHPLTAFSVYVLIFTVQHFP